MKSIFSASAPSKPKNSSLSACWGVTHSARGLERTMLIIWFRETGWKPVLRVADVLEFRFEETMEQRIDAEETLAVEGNFVTGDFGEILGDERGELGGEFLADVFAEFLAEIGGVDLTGFELEDHFADQLLVIGDGQGAVEGELAAFDFFDVLFPGIDVLVMNALEVPERGDAGADQVGAVPERIAVDETGVALGADERIG